MNNFATRRNVSIFTAVQTMSPYFPMPQIPQHKAALLSDFGMRLHKVTSAEIGSNPLGYAHQDDYYIFGLVENGEWKGCIDFTEYRCKQGELVLIQPGQVHNAFFSSDLEGTVLSADSCFVNDTNKHIFEAFRLGSPAAYPMDGQRWAELLQITGLMQRRMDSMTDTVTRDTLRSLTEAFVCIVAEAVRDFCRQQPMQPGKRQMEITLAFRELLAKDLHCNHRPSYYASQLNLSTAYLNEVVRSVTGMSVSRCIRSERVLQAKRLLVHTDLAVKEIADALGIDDYAYFSRLFTEDTGISPTAFRQRNLV